MSLGERQLEETFPWRPMYWPFRIPQRIGGWLRWSARLWLVAATTVFTIMALRGGIPRGLDRESWEVSAQLALFGILVLGEIVAWRWQAAGASVITLGAVALGVVASIAHSPRSAFLIAMIFFAPGFLYWLDWQRTRRVREIVTLAVVMALLLGTGGIASWRVYAAYRGPTHPASALVEPPATNVEWIWSGGQTEHSITVNAGLVRDSDAVYLAVSESSDLSGAVLYGPLSASQGSNNRTVSVTADGLKPDTQYYYAIQTDGELDRSRQGRFRTLASGPFSFTFAVSGCAATGSNGQVFDAIRASDPLFFLSTGDLFYENIDVNDPGRYRAAYREILASPAQAALYRSAPLVYLWDDHDFGPNDADRTAPGRDAAWQIYREMVPHHPLAAGEDTGPIYRAFTVGRVRFIVTDERSMKSPSTDPDNAEKTVLGAEQKAWFKQQLREANRVYPLIVWVGSLPWIGAADPSADFWAGYATERRELADFIAAQQIRGLLRLAGDAHMIAIDDGRNSDYSSTGGAGFPVFQAAALDRPGSVKGGPYSEGTHPGGGQFGLVTVADDGRAPVTVTFSGRQYTNEEIVRYRFTVPS